MAASPGRPRSSWSSVLADREYVALWLAYALSLAGDQLARVALAIERAGPCWSAVTRWPRCCSP